MKMMKLWMLVAVAAMASACSKQDTEGFEGATAAKTIEFVATDAGGRTIFGEPDGAAVSFLVGDIHPADLGTILDHLGIAVRTGHHCAQPLMDYLGIPGTARASFAVYNTKEEIDILMQGIERAVKMLS